MVWIREVSGTQKTFFIGIQDRHECDFRDVETLTQKVDADEHIEDIETHITDDLGPFQGVDIGVQVTHADAGLFHIVGQILCHTLRQRRHENFVVFFSFFLYFRNQIVDLSLHRAYLDIRVEKAGRADDLFGAQQLVVCLVVARRGRYEEDLIIRLRTRRSSTGGCLLRTADGIHSPPASISATGRRHTCCGSAEQSYATHPQ